MAVLQVDAIHIEAGSAKAASARATVVDSRTAHKPATLNHLLVVIPTLGIQAHALLVQSVTQYPSEAVHNKN